MMKPIGLLLLFGFALAAADLPAPLHKLGREERAARLRQDAAQVQRYREGISNVVAFLETRTNLWPAARLPDGQLLAREEREVVWAAWKRLLDYGVALDALGSYHQDFWRVSGRDGQTSFLIGHAACLAQYRYAMQFIARAEHNPELDKLLNEPVPEIGLEAGAYGRLKFRFLNVARAGEFAAQRAYFKTLKPGLHAGLEQGVAADAAYVWQMGQGRGELLTAKNGLNILKKTGLTAWLPVQTGVAEWMGDTKVYRLDQSLVAAEQIAALPPRLQPGDILLERREWYLSNIGLPGYWPHAALYVGTPAERRAFFNDAETAAWVRQSGEASGDLEALLARRYPEAYANCLRPQEHQHVSRVLEAMSEGVVFTTLEHSAACDALAVLRPRLSRRERAVALLTAFHYAGRPYDFNFDFATDATLVCSELIYKAYEPATGKTGLKIPLGEVLGRKVASANDLVALYDQQCGKPEQQMDLVLFLDGYERAKRAVDATEAEFRRSWQRPKWHILTQERGKPKR